MPQKIIRCNLYIKMNQSKHMEKLNQLQEKICTEKSVSSKTLRQLLGLVEQYGDSHRAVGLQDELLNIITDDFNLNMKESMD